MSKNLANFTRHPDTRDMAIKVSIQLAKFSR